MTAPIPLGRYDWATGQWMTPEEERAKVRNAALGDGFGPAFSPGEMAAARAPLPIIPPPTGLTGVDGYGQPVEQPVWQGYTLDDLLDRATTGSVTSSVPEGRTGYGLDEVGNANVSHNTSKKIDWQGLLGGALAGAGSVRAGDGWGSIGTGFLGGTNYQYGRETQARRNALTDSQIAYQGGRTDLNQLEILDYPTKQAREEVYRNAQLDRERAGTAESEYRLRYLLPSERTVNEEQAAAAAALAYRRMHPIVGGGTAAGSPVTPQQRLGAVERQIDDTRMEIGQTRLPARPDLAASAMDPALLPAYLADSAAVGKRLAGLRSRADSLGPVRDSLAAVVQGQPYQRPAAGTRGPLTAAPIYARPPAGGARAATGAGKQVVSQEVYDILVEDNGQAFADRYYTVGAE